MAVQGQDPEQFLADERFSRVFTYSGDHTQEHSKPICISYADYGYHGTDNSQAEKVFLYFGPLLGSRMLFVLKDFLAKENGVRIIHADRPGFGETPDVVADERLAFWRKATFALLQHLQIRHVHLGAQSAGTIYALDFILHYPEMLYSENAYLAIGAPWVHPSHSRIWHMSMTQALPNSLLGQVDKLVSLFYVVSAPVSDTSFGLTSAFGWWFGGQPSGENAAATAPDPEVAFAEALGSKAADFIYARPIHGISQESILLLQKTEGASGWADWGDYDTLVPRLRRALAEKNRRLMVDCFFSQTDSMIGDPGTAGPEWFTRCWRQDGKDDDVIQFSSRVIDGADHDSIWATEFGVARDVFDPLKFDAFSKLPRALVPASIETSKYAGAYVKLETDKDTKQDTHRFDWNSFKASVVGYKGDYLAFNKFKSTNIAPSESTVQIMAERIVKFLFNMFSVSVEEGDIRALISPIEATFINLKEKSSDGFLDFNNSNDGGNSSWEYRMQLALPIPEKPDYFYSLVTTIKSGADASNESEWWGLVPSSSKILSATLDAMDLIVMKSFQNPE
ncbi:hypothetical protein CSOJ01_11342 [Colletotrichum sojae]|uniref:AB hydrolase-1 domain-containing protein n=1 Tax=Colletotrichum sojae TaxID=2175907 RepID=A0A8H6MNU8_9PEZI|nr:hypothetical protein CSOJ01_11342 [Colletotrichum sojae]